MTTVGERIKELREAKGLSVERLAKKLKVPAETVIAWESGEAQPNNKAAGDLAIFLSSSAGYIQFGVDNSAQIRTMFPNKTKPEKVGAAPILLMVSAMFLFVGLAGAILLFVMAGASMDAMGLVGYWAYFEHVGYIPSIIAFASIAAVGIIIGAVALIMGRGKKKGKQK